MHPAHDGAQCECSGTDIFCYSAGPHLETMEESKDRVDGALEESPDLVIASKGRSRHALVVMEGGHNSTTLRHKQLTCLNDMPAFESTDDSVKAATAADSMDLLTQFRDNFNGTSYHTSQVLAHPCVLRAPRSENCRRRSLKITLRLCLSNKPT